MEKTFLDKLKEFFAKVVKYLKENYLSYITLGLTILLFIFLVLPAAETAITNVNFSSLSNVYEQIELTSGTDFRFSIANLLKGDIIQSVVGSFKHTDGAGNVLSETIEKTFGVVYFPYNVYLGLGLLFILISTILMLFPKLVMRIVASVLSLVGAFLQISIYTQPMFKGELPIIENGLSVTGSVKYLAGPIFYIIVAFAIAGLTIAITILHLLKHLKHQQNETERYLRGGV